MIELKYKLDFFEEEEEEKSEIEYILSDFKEVKETCDKVRKSMYAKHGALEKKYMDLQERMQIIERNICKQI